MTSQSNSKENSNGRAVLLATCTIENLEAEPSSRLRMALKNLTAAYSCSIKLGHFWLAYSYRRAVHRSVHHDTGSYVWACLDHFTVRVDMQKELCVRPPRCADALDQASAPGVGQKVL